jgi:rfaE bifunctional protein nucleotidyltransferase chain/domain
LKINSPIILSLDQIQKNLELFRCQGKKVILTNGCFDLLHIGHIASLKFAKSQGDILVVAVNDDASVRRLKGASRPILHASMRMELLSELKVVDYELPFSQDNALEVIKRIKPDVYIKGEDYHLLNTPEGIEVLKYGGKILSAPLVPSISTTDIIEKIYSLENHSVTGKTRLDHEEMKE